MRQTEFFAWNSEPAMPPPERRRLTDLRRPALVVNGEVRWMMTDGGDNIRACVPVEGLEMLADGGGAATLDLFNKYRTTLSRLASDIFAQRDSEGSETVRVDAGYLAVLESDINSG
jgi:hypothetical protein